MRLIIPTYDKLKRVAHDPNVPTGAWTCVIGLVVFIVLAGQLISAALALGITLSLLWNLGLAHVPGVFRVFVVIAFVLNVVVTFAASMTVFRQARNRVIDVEMCCIICGFLLSYPIAMIWLNKVVS